MKHLATIQTEFSKLAFSKQAISWDDFSRKQQMKYLQQHPKSKRRLTADFVDSWQDTKESYLKGLSSWAAHEKHHPKLAMTVKNFMSKYLPEKFDRKIFTDDLEVLPDDLYERLIKKYDMKEYLDEESGGQPESSLAIIDEKSETPVKRITGGEYLRSRLATGLFNGKRMIISASERTGLAPVYSGDVIIRKMPYSGGSVEIILGR